MSVGRHFGMVISRMPRLTYVATVRASEDCRFVCSTCYENCWAIHRLHGETAWMCSRCADLKDNGLTPGPRSFHTQPPRPLRVGEQLRSPSGVWDVTSSERVWEWEGRRLRQPARVYVVTREDGHREEWRGHDMADFHLIPAEFEHITRSRRNELGSALTAAGLSWEDNGRRATPRRLTYTVTGPRGCQWAIRPVPGIDFDPWQPSNLWRAVRAAPPHQSPVMSARALADHIRGGPRVSGQLRPWRPEDFDDRCETCGAPPGQLCHAWCDTGYTAEDARRDAEIRDQGARNPAPSTPPSHPKE